MLRVFQKQKNDVTIDFLVRVAISIYLLYIYRTFEMYMAFVYISTKHLVNMEVGYT